VPLRGDVLGEQQDAARVLVEAVDDPDAWVGVARAGQPELGREPLEDAVALVAAGDRRQARGFGDGNDVVVLVEDVEGRFGHGC
jgi:hypothetical protein